MRAYGHLMSIAKLLGIVLAVAILFGPAFSRAGEAFAAVPDHHAQMMQSGDCHAPATDSSSQDKAPAKSCCISMCMAAVAMFPASSLSDPSLNLEPAVSAIAPLHLSYLGELSTPPPRHS